MIDNVDGDTQDGDGESSHPPPKSVIVKVPNVDSLSHLYQISGRNEADDNSENCDVDVTSTIRLMHNDECAIYKLLDGQGVVPMARCLAAVPSVPGGDCGLLMLEDVSEKAVGMKSLADYLNLNQTYEMVEALASLHAWSVRTTVSWREHVPRLSDRFEIYGPFFQLTAMLAPMVRDKLAEEFGQVPVDKLLSYVNVDSYVRILAPEITARPSLPIVLVHGDIHCSNVMFEKRADDGQAGGKLVALLDFQLVHSGYGTEDLARLMIYGTSSAIRRQYEDSILARYVEAFNSKVGDPCSRIKLDDVKEAYDEMFCLIAVWLSMAAGFAEDFLKKALDKLSDESERKATVRNFVLNCAAFYRDATKMLGWQ